MGQALSCAWWGAARWRACLVVGGIRGVFFEDMFFVRAPFFPSDLLILGKLPELSLYRSPHQIMYQCFHTELMDEDVWCGIKG